jgi:YVTN family beta-propeller protein
MLLILVAAGLVFGAAQMAVTKAGASLVKNLDQTWGKYKLESIVMCANGTEAVAAAIGPGSLDDLKLFKLTGVNTASPKVKAGSTVLFGDNDDFGPGPGVGGGTGIPAGMGPRGFPGISVSLDCNTVYVPNFFLDSVVKVDMQTGAAATASNDAGSVLQDDGTIAWPASFEASFTAVDGSTTIPDSLRTIPQPVDAELNSTGEDRLIVSSQAGDVYVLDSATGAVMKKVSTGGVGPRSLIVNGNSWAAAVQNNGTLACIDLSTYKVATISGLGNHPFMGVRSNDAETVYVSNQGSNSVTVLQGSGCSGAGPLTATTNIPVGNAPRYLALSPDNRFLYVSNATDNTVSVIDTGSLSVVSTISIAAPGEQAPAGLVAVSNNNQYLYVLWEGAIKSGPGKFRLEVYDVSGLY